MKLYQFIVILALGGMAGAILTSIEIPIVKNKQFQQFIREEGPRSHQKKEGTPTMGGVAIFLATLAATMIGIKPTLDLFVIVLVALGYGLIGFLDDYIKVTARHNLGLRAWQKLVLQILIGVLVAIYLKNFTELGSQVWIPFVDKSVDFGMLFIPFVAFVLVAMANSVNLTDGLDGLCGGVSAIFALTFAIIANHFAAYASTDFLMALCGALIGFLIFNRHPAQIFMGDTGSMMIGGGLTAAVLFTKAELLIPLAGLIFVLESLSVIIQVISFKTTGKRVFRMSPLHHHFELGGMSEVHVVYMFWAVTAVCCAVTLAIVFLL